MNNKWNHFWESKLAYLLLAFVSAVGLFAYVNAESMADARQTDRRDNAITATTTRTINVPLQLNADTDKYFITGYPTKVAVTLEGSNALVTMTANTMNFRVIADLNKLGTGEHTVTLTQEGLNKDLSYTIKPKTIKVNIQGRRSKKMPIQVRYNKARLADNYVAATPQLSSQTVDVTGSRSEIARLYEVVAVLTLPRDTKHPVEQEAMLQALDEAGNTVNAVLTPQTVHVTLPVSLPKKEVPVTFKLTGELPDNRQASYVAKPAKVTVYGAQKTLDELTAIPVTIDQSKLTTTTQRTFRVNELVDGLIASDPETVTANITVANLVSQDQTSKASSSSKASDKD